MNGLVDVQRRLLAEPWEIKREKLQLMCGNPENSINLFKHISHWKGRSPVCVFRKSEKIILRESLQLQMLKSYPHVDIWKFSKVRNFRNVRISGITLPKYGFREKADGHWLHLKGRSCTASTMLHDGNDRTKLKLDERKHTGERWDPTKLELQ